MRALDTAANPLLSVKSLRKVVPGGRVLFSGLNLTVNAGEFVAIMGESWSGKSTLLNLIAGLDVADAGSIAIDGLAFLATEVDEAGAAVLWVTPSRAAAGGAARRLPLPPQGLLPRHER